MFEDLWNGILELTAKFVIPDWNSVVAMLPVLIFAASVVVIVAASATPPGAEEPLRGCDDRPSHHPASTCRVLRGPGLCRERAAAVPRSVPAARCHPRSDRLRADAALLAGRVSRSATATWARQLRCRQSSGPPPGVHMPGPSFPLPAAIGLAMLLLGLVFGGSRSRCHRIHPVAAWLDVGGAAGVRQDEEADTTGHLEAMPIADTEVAADLSGGAARGRLRDPGRLDPAARQRWWVAAAASGPRSSRATRAGASPGRPGEPRASPGASGGPRRAGHPRGRLSSKRPSPRRPTCRSTRVRQRRGIHNVEIEDGSGASVFKGEIFAGVATMVYDVPRRGDVRLRLLGPPEYDRVRDDPVGSSPKELRHAASTVLLAWPSPRSTVGVWWFWLSTDDAEPRPRSASWRHRSWGRRSMARPSTCAIGVDR